MDSECSCSDCNNILYLTKYYSCVAPFQCSHDDHDTEAYVITRKVDTTLKPVPDAINM